MSIEIFCIGDVGSESNLRNRYGKFSKYLNNYTGKLFSEPTSPIWVELKRHLENYLSACNSLVAGVGFEPTTSGL